jgi:hypothetical protein
MNNRLERIFKVDDLKLSWQQNSIKSSQPTSRVSSGQKHYHYARYYPGKTEESHTKAL